MIPKPLDVMTSDAIRALLSSPTPRSRKIIGVIGGIASGKSAARRILQDLGADILDADAVAHEVLERRLVAEEVAKKLGIKDLFTLPNATAILDSADGSNEVAKDVTHVNVDRKKVARVVFGETLEAKLALQTLESIVQPKIAEAIHAKIEAWKSAGSPALLVLDIPLLFERGWEQQCHEVWFIDTPIEMRRKFASARGWTSEQLATRELAQLSVDEKRIRADVVIPNNSDLYEFDERIRLAVQRTVQ